MAFLQIAKLQGTCGRSSSVPVGGVAALGQARRLARDQAVTTPPDALSGLIRTPTGGQRPRHGQSRRRGRSTCSGVRQLPTVLARGGVVGVYGLLGGPDRHVQVGLGPTVSADVVASFRGARRGGDPRRGVGAGPYRALLSLKSTLTHVLPVRPAGGVRGDGAPDARKIAIDAFVTPPWRAGMRGTAIAFTGVHRTRWSSTTRSPSSAPTRSWSRPELTAVSQGTDRAMVAWHLPGRGGPLATRSSTAIPAWGSGCRGRPAVQGLAAVIACSLAWPEPGSTRPTGTASRAARTRPARRGARDRRRPPPRRRGIRRRPRDRTARGHRLPGRRDVESVHPNSRASSLAGLGAIGQSLPRRGAGPGRVEVGNGSPSRRAASSPHASSKVKVPRSRRTTSRAASRRRLRGIRPRRGRGTAARPLARYEQRRWAGAGGAVDVIIDATGRADAFEAYVGLLRPGGLPLPPGLLRETARPRLPRRASQATDHSMPGSGWIRWILRDRPPTHAAGGGPAGGPV